MGDIPLLDSKDDEPNITLEDCKNRAINHPNANYMVYGGNGTYHDGPRCAIFRSCNKKLPYNPAKGGNPGVYKKKSLATLEFACDEVERYCSQGNTKCREFNCPWEIHTNNQ